MSEQRKPHRREIWRTVVSQTEQALRCNALHPIQTEQSLAVDKGIPFSIRWVSSLIRKDLDTRLAGPRGPAGDPFLPPEAALTVSNISDSHVAVLNKYNVFEHHLLIVTRGYQHQQTPLNLDDCAALWQCLADFPSLGFYNSGKVAGASQTHKHLQLVPLPLTDTAPIPIDAALSSVRAAGRFHHVPVFEFMHCFYGFEPFTDTRSAAAETFSVYLSMLQQLGLTTDNSDGEPRVTQPYNLLISPAWMMLVPRSRERFHDISINALGYAGSFFTRRQQQAEVLRTQGPLRALEAVSL